jgi:type II secretory pathway pseudopilin PulG
MEDNDTCRAERGFSLVELMGALAVIVIMVMSMQGTMFSSIKIRASNSSVETRQAQAYDYIQRLVKISFGSPTDPAPTPAQLTELFDDDQDLGTVSLKQIQTPATSAGHSFTTSLADLTTAWRIVVNNDFNADQLTDGFREGRPDLLQIEVYANDVLMMRTMRAASVSNTRKD